MSDERILITGIGAVSAAGRTLAETLEAFAAGHRRGGRVTLFETPLEYPVFEVQALPPDAAAGDGSRTLHLTLAAVREALAAAGLTAKLCDLRVGVSLGTTVASQLSEVEFYAAYRRTLAPPLEPVTRYLKGNLAAAVGRAVRASGPCLTVVNACSSGADAIGAALSWLRAGECDLAIAGGGDELSRVALSGFGSLGVVSPALCAPFDRDRQGLNLGEGAGVLILERASSARRRNRASRLFLAGYGAACDAYHLTAPRPDGTGLEAAIRRALDEARIGPEPVGFVNAHGTATRDNDKVEGAVLARVFGPDVPVVATKGFTGHTLGAAGGLEAAFTAAGLRDGWIPASPGFANRDAEIPLAPVRERTALAVGYALSTNLAFGGNNAALILGRARGGPA